MYWHCPKVIVMMIDDGYDAIAGYVTGDEKSLNTVPSHYSYDTYLRKKGEFALAGSSQSLKSGQLQETVGAQQEGIPPDAFQRYSMKTVGHQFMDTFASVHNSCGTLAQQGSDNTCSDSHAQTPVITVTTHSHDWLCSTPRPLLLSSASASA